MSLSIISLSMNNAASLPHMGADLISRGKKTKALFVLTWLLKGGLLSSYKTIFVQYDFFFLNYGWETDKVIFLLNLYLWETFNATKQM